MSKHAKILILFTLVLFVSTFAQTAEKPAEEIKCPVTGEKADPKVTAEYKGVTFSFCCEKAKDKFLKDPTQYVCEGFVCPKCDGVCAEKAGKCSKCGTELQAKIMAKNSCAQHQKAGEKKTETAAAVKKEKKDKDCGGCPAAAACLGKEKKEAKK